MEGPKRGSAVNCDRDIATRSLRM